MINKDNDIGGEIPLIQLKGIRIVNNTLILLGGINQQGEVDEATMRSYKAIVDSWNRIGRKAIALFIEYNREDKSRLKDMKVRVMYEEGTLSKRNTPLTTILNKL